MPLYDLGEAVGAFCHALLCNEPDIVIINLFFPSRAGGVNAVGWPEEGRNNYQPFTPPVHIRFDLRNDGKVAA